MVEIISRNIPKYFVIYQNNRHGLFAMTQGFEKVPVCQRRVQVKNKPKKFEIMKNWQDQVLAENSSP